MVGGEHVHVASRLQHAACMHFVCGKTKVTDRSEALVESGARAQRDRMQLKRVSCLCTQVFSRCSAAECRIEGCLRGALLGAGFPQRHRRRMKWPAGQGNEAAGCPRRRGGRPAGLSFAEDSQALGEGGSSLSDGEAARQTPLGRILCRSLCLGELGEAQSGWHDLASGQQQWVSSKKTRRDVER